MGGPVAAERAPFRTTPDAIGLAGSMPVIPSCAPRIHQPTLAAANAIPSSAPRPALHGVCRTVPAPASHCLLNAIAAWAHERFALHVAPALPAALRANVRYRQILCGSAPLESVRDATESRRRIVRASSQWRCGVPALSFPSSARGGHVHRHPGQTGAPFIRSSPRTGDPADPAVPAMPRRGGASAGR